MCPISDASQNAGLFGVLPQCFVEALLLDAHGMDGLVCERKRLTT